MNEEDRLKLLELLGKEGEDSFSPFVVSEIQKIFDKYKDVPLPPGVKEYRVEDEIKLEIARQDDWRMKAKLAAMLISKNIDV